MSFISSQPYKQQRYPSAPRGIARFLTLAPRYALMACVASPCLSQGQEEPASSKFRDPEDGAFDMSGFVDSAAGFVPIVSPITEPAVGYGAFGALVFIDRQDQAESNGFNRPNLDIVGGLATENGTKGFMAADIRYWLDDRLKTNVKYFNAELTLDFHGFGEYPQFEDLPITYTRDVQGFGIGAQYRLGAESQFWAGLSFTSADTDITFDLGELVPPALVPDTRKTTSGQLTPSLRFDSRDSGFTPNKGTYFSLEPTFFNEAFGGDRNYELLDVNLLHYIPLQNKMYLGLRLTGTSSFGDIPFYEKPALSLRGLPAAQYQGDDIAETELELRWQLWNRFSLIGFAGLGGTWTHSEDESFSDTIVSGGTGFRYELARRYKIHGGIDIAFGPDSSAFYFVVGSAWNRP